jgi:2,3-bisphosphoglycerate-dependent phosphoglycerate mutase
MHACPRSISPDGRARSTTGASCARSRQGAAKRPGHQLELLRHGETARNANGLITGAADITLTDNGWRRAIDAGGDMRAGYDVAFSSQLERSIETLELALGAAQAIADARAIDPRLAERSLGELEGLPSRPIPAYDAGDLAWAPPQGDSYLVVTQRVLSFLLGLRYATTPSASPAVLVCSHMGPMRILVATLTGIADAAEVMTGQFMNARVMHLDVGSLPWPAFLPVTP